MYELQQQRPPVEYSNLDVVWTKLQRSFLYLVSSSLWKFTQANSFKLGDCELEGSKPNYCWIVSGTWLSTCLGLKSITNYWLTSLHDSFTHHFMDKNPIERLRETWAAQEKYHEPWTTGVVKLSGSELLLFFKHASGSSQYDHLANARLKWAG